MHKIARIFGKLLCGATDEVVNDSISHALAQDAPIQTSREHPASRYAELQLGEDDTVFDLHTFRHAKDPDTGETLARRGERVVPALEDGDYWHALDCVITAGFDDQVIPILRDAPSVPDSESHAGLGGLWDKLRWSFEDMPLERARGLSRRVYDFVWDELIKRELAPQVRGQLLEEFLEGRQLGFSHPEGRFLQLDAMLKLPENFYGIMEELPRGNFERIFDELMLTCRSIDTRRGDISDDALLREFDDVYARMRIWWYRSHDPDARASFAAWALQNPVRQAAAARMVKNVIDRGIYDPMLDASCGRGGLEPKALVAGRQLDLSGLGLTDLHPEVNKNWLREIDLSNNALTEIPEWMFSIVHRDEASKDVRCRIDLRGNPLKLSRAQYDRIQQYWNRSGPIFELDPSAEPMEGRISSPTGWWTVLGVAQNAPATEIKNRYRDLVLQSHPDKHLQHEKDHWTKVTAQITAAYDEAKVARLDLQ